MTEYAWLSPGTLCDLIELVREQKAEAADAEKLRDEFVKYVEAGRALPPGLIQWVTRGFIEQRRRKQSLDQALGLVRPRAGKPKADPGPMMEIALTMLCVRLAGEQHKEALYRARKEWRCKDRKLNNAWKTHKIEAFLELRLRRSLESLEWTADEVEILRKVFKNEKHKPAPWLNLTTG